MPHEHGDVLGPTTKGGKRPDDSALPGEHAAGAQPSPPPPLGYGEGASETFGTAKAAPDAEPEKFYNPSEGESPTRTSALQRGGSTSIPGEDS